MNQPVKPGSDVNRERSARFRLPLWVVLIAAFAAAILVVLGRTARSQRLKSDPFAAEPRRWSGQWLREPLERNRFLRNPIVGSDLSGLTFTSDGQRGWAVGEHGTILSTRDGGASWQSQWSGTKSALLSVTFGSDGQRGWAVGDQGAILSTRDGGKFWQAQPNGCPHRLCAVAFTSDGQLGWAVGGDSTILSTRDAGGTWVMATYARYPAPWIYPAAFLVLVAAMYAGWRRS